VKRYRQVNAAIHEMSREAVAERTRRDAGPKARAARDRRDDLAHVLRGAMRRREEARPKERAALAVLKETRGARCRVPRGSGSSAWPIALALLHHELVAFAVDVGGVQRAELARAKTATVEQQDDETIPPRAQTGRGGGAHQMLGLLEVKELRHRTANGVLQAEPVEHVAFGATAAPGVIEQAPDVTQVLARHESVRPELTLLFPASVKSPRGSGANRSTPGRRGSSPPITPA